MSTPNLRKFRHSEINDLAGGGCDVKSIDQLLDSSKVGHCWIYATIVAVENDRNWCYLSCKKCIKKVNPIETRFHCEKCDSFKSDGILRFKVQLRVIDETGSTSFLMWDCECLQLIRKTATTLNEDMVQNTEDLSCPNDIKALVDRKILFKVQVRQQNIEQRSDIFTVMRLTVDDSLISKYVIFPNVESQDSTSDNEVNTPTKTHQMPPSLDELEPNNKAKRTLDIYSSTQLSSNKSRRIIKHEKP